MNMFKLSHFRSVGGVRLTCFAKYRNSNLVGSPPCPSVVRQGGRRRIVGDRLKTCPHRYAKHCRRAGTRKRGPYIFVALVCLLWFGALALRAEDRYVVEVGTPGGTNTPPYTNWNIAATQIQWAVDVATNAGDTVWVSNGVYKNEGALVHYAYGSFGQTNTSVVCLTNQITLKSVNGPSVTVIDAQYPTVNAQRGAFISGGATLSGFTIRCGKAAPTNCTKLSAGGVLIEGREGTIGGTLTNCIVWSNYAGYGAGGIEIQFTTTPPGLVANCTIYSNESAGLCVGYNNAIIRNCVIWGNKQSTYDPGGGGIDVDSSGTVNIENCLFYRNTSIGRGGGLRRTGGPVGSYLDNCTFVGNTAAVAGAGIYLTNSNMSVRNTIIYGNTAPADADVVVTNSLLTNCCLSVTNVWTAGHGNITNNPLFINAADYNYRLDANSPCINAGINQSWMTNAFDLDGRRRIIYGIVDMGAYEHIHEGTIYTAH